MEMNGWVWSGGLAPRGTGRGEAGLGGERERLVLPEAASSGVQCDPTGPACLGIHRRKETAEHIQVIPGPLVGSSEWMNFE